ncbi:hypothetical protein N8I74_19130 [Chitiniphilus purpureus]|uniref:DUF1311 domain-containing protein n=1 Tax=Chitiniphilus purpureus TaxID=2981137 RepID=A0ABY6DM05_9NEIS|nr:hypothetical protein [Chitiniphilus sp. CD1]UXY15397.1 hypothetical protein N8I74_19130 [Chitiniphilus sp. CD1]
MGKKMWYRVTVCLGHVALLGLALPSGATGIDPAGEGERMFRQQAVSCVQQGGDARQRCLEEAQLDRTIAQEDARAELENTAAARLRAARNKVEALYTLESARCERSGTGRGAACRQQASEQRNTALADLKRNADAFVSYDSLAAGIGEDSDFRRAALNCTDDRSDVRDRCVKRFLHRQAL